MHVLVYDHSAVLLARFQDRLLSEGMRVTARFPRELSVEHVRNHAPDVLVLGVTEEWLGTGLARLREIRDDPTTLHIPAIVATPAGANIDVEIDDVLVSHCEFSVQPFDIENLVGLLHELKN